MPSESDSDDYPRAPAQKARDENILGVFEETTDPVLTTAEVADELPIGKRATLNRLEDLVERDALTSKDVGVGRVWWLPESEVPRSPPAEPVGQGPDDRTAIEQTTQRGEPHATASSTGTDGVTVHGPNGSGERRTENVEPLETEQPRWAFIGSLGRHSVFAGVFALVLLLIKAETQSLLPISAASLLLTAFVFFLIGIPAQAAYRTKKYFESTNLSLTEVLWPFGSRRGGDFGS